VILYIIRKYRAGFRGGAWGPGPQAPHQQLRPPTNSIQANQLQKIAPKVHQNSPAQQCYSGTRQILNVEVSNYYIRQKNCISTHLYGYVNILDLSTGQLLLLRWKTVTLILIFLCSLVFQLESHTYGQTDRRTGKTRNAA